MLPGPPRELRPMFDNLVVPLLRREFPLAAPFVCRTLRTSGIAESLVQEKIEAPLDALVAAGLEIGYCARTGQVDVRLSARGGNGKKIVRAAEAIVQKILGAQIYGFDDEEMETVVVRLLTGRKKTLALAESCTGGCLAHRVTNVPGASAVFLGGFVTYSNEAKQKFLGVRAETLAAHGAVSEAVAREMAEGARSTNSARILPLPSRASPGRAAEQKKNRWGRFSSGWPENLERWLSANSILMSAGHSRKSRRGRHWKCCECGWFVLEGKKNWSKIAPFNVFA